MTPQAVQRTAFQEDRRADARPIVDGKSLYVKNRSVDHFLLRSRRSGALPLISMFQLVERSFDGATVAIDETSGPLAHLRPKRFIFHEFFQRRFELAFSL